MPIRNKPITPIFRRGFDHAAHFVSRAYPALPLVVPRFRDVEIVRDVAYAGTGRRAHHLDVFRPRGRRGPLPTVFYVHGGAFSTCSKDTHHIMGYALAAEGFQVFLPSYRLGPEHTYPGPLEDVVAAFEWVLDHGADYGADLDRLALMGESAGANFVSALAVAATEPRPEPFARRLFERNPRVRAVLPIYGLLDLVHVERLWSHPRKRGRMPELVKRELRWCATSYVGHPRVLKALDAELASPLRLLERTAPPGSRPLPPFFLSVGTKDPVMHDSVRMRAAVAARGAHAELHLFPGELHAFNAMLWRPAAREKWSLVRSFLERSLAEAPRTRDGRLASVPPAPV